MIDRRITASEQPEWRPRRNGTTDYWRLDTRSGLVYAAAVPSGDAWDVAVWRWGCNRCKPVTARAGSLEAAMEGVAGMLA